MYVFVLTCEVARYTKVTFVHSWLSTRN